eukprot:gene12693-6587_t
MTVLKNYSNENEWKTMLASACLDQSRLINSLVLHLERSTRRNKEKDKMIHQLQELPSALNPSWKQLIIDESNDD